MTRLLIALFVALGLGFVARGSAQAQYDFDINCGQIATREDAQQILNYDTDDPFGLDGPIGPGNGNGIACDGTDVGGSITYEVFLTMVGAAPTPAPTEAPAAPEAPAEQPEAPAEQPAAPATGATLPDTGAGVMAASSSMGLVSLFVAFGLMSAGVALRTRRI